jgi:hypothetical protein
MKTRKDVIEELKHAELIEENKKRVSIGSDLELLQVYANQRGYIISAWDYLAIGYMCGCYGLITLFDEERLVQAIHSYDLNNPIILCDTVGEVFIDLLDLKL